MPKLFKQKSRAAAFGGSFTILLVLHTALISCAAQKVPFDFETSDGKKIALEILSSGMTKDQADGAAGDATHKDTNGENPAGNDFPVFVSDLDAATLMDTDIQSGGKGATSGPRFGLAESYTVPGSGLSLRLGFTTGAQAIRAEFFSGTMDAADRIAYTFTRRGNGSPGEAVYFPLPAGFSFRSIRFSLLGGTPVLRIGSMRIVRSPVTATLDSDRVAGQSVVSRPKLQRVKMGGLYPEELDRNRAYYLKFDYVWDAEKAGAVTPGENDLVGLIAYGPGGKTFSWDMRVRPGRHSIYLHQSFVAFLPNEIAVADPVAGFGFTGFEYGSIETKSDLAKNGGNARPSDTFAAPQPIPADLGTILRFPQNAWRQKNFEVFSWSLFPKILLIDFADVDVQDRFVKRLAFFVEKRGFRGTLMSNSQLAGKHGWNANNYNPEGLSAFYNSALDTGFKLNEEELLLRELSRQWGILTFENGRYGPGSGGVLSVARGAGMSHVTRTVLIQHESLHGAFYELPDFQKQSFEEFDALPASAKSFIIRFFEFMQYDSADRYLMVNETQAYLLQQTLNSLRNYITVRIPQRIAQVYPDQLQRYTNAGEAALPGLAAAAQRLSDTLYKESGVRIGLMECLLPRSGDGD